MPKTTRQAKARATKPERPAKKASKPAVVARPAAVAAAATREVEEDEAAGERGGPMCRSCGKRPGRPTAILGQMTQAELCAQCTALRKERIRLNRAAARGLRSTRLF
jgi:hypothetical protein